MKGNRDKRREIFLTLVLCIILFGVPQILTGIRNRCAEKIHNVFDEMAADDYKGLKKAKYISAGIWDDPHYNNLPGYIKSSIEFVQPSSDMGVGKFILFRFVIFLGEGHKGDIIFAYNSSFDKLYIYSENAIPIEDRERYRDYLLGDVITGGWIENGKSQYTEEYLGEYEIIDYLFPYEYCGMTGDRSVKEDDIIYGDYAEHYIVWLDSEELLCIQQTAEKRSQYDHLFASDDSYQSFGEQIMREPYRTDAGSTRFLVQRKTDGSRCRFSDIVDTGPDFLGWLKTSGQAEGNLKKIARDRESGEKDTQEMLERCPEGEMAAVLEDCEFYMEPGYLHFKFPYWNDMEGRQGWERNGNTLWRGWLTVKTEDIEGFLKVGRW